MAEILGVLGFVALLAGITVLSYVLSWDARVLVGGGLIALGLLTSIPPLVYYHWLLRRALAAIGPVPKRWWVRPFDHMSGVKDELARKRIMRWAGASLAGAVVIALGLIVVVVSLVTRG